MSSVDIKEKTAQVYDKIAAGYSAGHFDHFWVEEFDFFKNIIKGKKVIDLGCGAGRDAVVFMKNGFDYTGIDVSEGMLQVANTRVPKGKFQQMDFSQTTFLDAMFDGFWAAASFLHIPKKDVAAVLHEAKRITKKDGVGFISVEEKADIDEGMIDENKYGGVSRYFSFYTQDEFQKILEQNGFSIIKMSRHVKNGERKTNWLCYFVKIV
ncbi:MAG TPA: class I SAM-dependent methyltransferase [bacterium]|nr:class I SAM-dependent methyltransferase [bacterium]